MSSPTCPLCGSALVKKGKRWYCPSCDRFWYVCRYCGEVFEGQRSLAAHMRVHRRDRAVDVADIVFEYARGMGLALGGGYRRIVVELVERGLEPGEAAAVAVALSLLKNAEKGCGGGGSPRPVVRGGEASPSPSSRGEAVGNVKVPDEMPGFIKNNPWLKALSGRR